VFSKGYPKGLKGWSRRWTKLRKPRQLVNLAVPKAKKVQKPRKAPVTDEVLKIIKKHKKGVDISQLKANTGFGDSRLRMIVSKAYKQGKIKRIARGIYVVA
jgi:predicted transcriptional regulator of viral defense system